MLPRDGAPALCVLSILRAPCPRVTKSFLRGVPRGPPGSAQARGPGPGGWLLPHGFRPPPLQGKMVLSSTGWAFQCRGPQAPADCACHSDKPPRTLKLPSSALLTALRGRPLAEGRRKPAGGSWRAFRGRPRPWRWEGRQKRAGCGVECGGVYTIQ
ncbi:hypothetical protein R6Z07F_015921 [Ovis aries]